MTFYGKWLDHIGLPAVSSLADRLFTLEMAQDVTAQLVIVTICALIAWGLQRLLLPLLKRRRLVAENGTDLSLRWRPSPHFVWVVLLAALLVVSENLLAATQLPYVLVRAIAHIAAAWALIRYLARQLLPAAISQLLALIVWSVATLSILHLLEPLTRALDRAELVFGKTHISVLSVLSGLLIATLGIFASSRIGAALEKHLASSNRIDSSAKIVVSKLARFAMVIFVVLVAIDVAGVDLAGLTIFSGALGLGVGFGLQKVISNLMSGLILLLDRSLKPGDVIEFESPHGVTYGWIEKLSARYTAVRTRDGTETLIPNEYLITSSVTNWSYSDKNVRIRLEVGVSYNSDIDLAVALCLQAAKAVSRVLPTPQPVCLVTGFGDSSVNLELRFWINDPAEGIQNVRSLVFLEIWRCFRANGVEIPFPQRDLHLRSAVPLQFAPPEAAPPEAAPPEAAPAKAAPAKAAPAKAAPASDDKKS